MPTNHYAEAIARELQQSVQYIAHAQTDKLENAIAEAANVYVAGAGRSGLMGRAFAMRLMHLGITCYVVGETVTPGMREGDLLIIGSGSGETKSLVSMADKAKSLNAQVALVTINAESTLGRKSDVVVTLPGVTKDQSAGSGVETIQPMGSLYEQTLLLFYDAVILGLMAKRGLSSSAMYGRHANLE